MTSVGACGVCGGPMDPSRAVYDKSGNLMCPACSAKDQIHEGDQRVVRSLVSAAIGVVVAGVLAWTCCNPFFIASFIAVTGGIGWVATILRAPEYRARMGGKFVPCLVAVILGLFLGGTPPLLVLLGISVAAIGR